MNIPILSMYIYMLLVVATNPLTYQGMLHLLMIMLISINL